MSCGHEGHKSRTRLNTKGKTLKSTQNNLSGWILTAMFKESSIPSFYDLMYLGEDSASNPTPPPPLSPINYDGDIPNKEGNPASTSQFEGYDDSYLVGGLCHMPPPSSLTNRDDTESWEAENGESVQNAADNHPGPPWFRWQEGKGYLGYQVTY